MARSYVLLKVLAASCLGVYFTVVYLETSPRFMAIVLSELRTQFKQKLGVEFQGKLKQIDLLRLAIQLEDASFVPLNKEEGWCWSAARFDLGLSWLSFFYSGKFDLSIDFKNYDAVTALKNGQLGIIEHVKKVVGGLQVPIPLNLYSITFHNSQMTIDLGKDNSARFTWNGQLGQGGKLFKARFYLTDGEIVFDQKRIVSEIAGTNSITLVPGPSLHYHAKSDLNLVIDHLPEKERQCTLEGFWSNGSGGCVLYNRDYSFHVDPLRTYWHAGQFMCEGTVTLPCSYLARLSAGDSFADQVGGTCEIFFFGDPARRVSGTVTFKEPRYGGYGVERLVFSFLTDCLTAHGALSVYKQTGRFAGAWQANLIEKTFKTDLVNHTAWPFGAKRYWEIPAHTGRASLSVDKYRKVNADYRVITRHIKTESVVQSKGSCTVSPAGRLYALGEIDGKKYHTVLQLFPFFKPLYVTYSDKQQHMLLSMKMKAPSYEQFQLAFSYDLVRSFLHNFFDYDLPGQGRFIVSGTYDGNRVDAHVQSETMTMRLPETYNFISSIDGRFAMETQSLHCAIKDFRAQLHKGMFLCSQGQININEYSEIEFMHLPLRAHKCFINWRDDFFAVASGSCVLQKRKGDPYSVDGFVTIEKGQLKENPLSRRGQREMTQFILPLSLFAQNNLRLNIALMSREPLHIKTPQLQSQAVVDVQLNGTLAMPGVTGKLKLLGGVLAFPYKPLYVTRAELHFLRDQPYDPVVELVAQGTIKKYHVTVSVGGTLQAPQITLGCVPALSEEQIIALLFTGSVEESLNVMVPTLVMRNIENLIFGTASSRSSEKWFDPFRRIRIVPSFIDQTGRGGFRGALEIDVSDQLHAKLQKNFSLSEDTRIEVEYLVSDDIGLKAIKDERSDIGAEIEMRFKF